jgi:nucleotide-binding universal stress UspA family protein
MTIHRLLCPTDFSEASDHALMQAAALARWYEARLTVLHVRLTVTPHPDMPSGGPMAPWLETETEALRKQTTEACRAIIDAGTPVDVAVLHGEPVPLILAMADSLPADLVVMGTHGTTGFQHLILGSVTEKVLRKATCPVLTVPRRSPAAAGRPFTSVLCGVDFSDCSIKAVQFAASIARQSGATLTLVHVLEWPWQEPPTPALMGGPPEQVRALIDYREYLESDAASRLEDIAGTARSDGPAPKLDVRFGRAYVELLDAAREQHADLIVVGVRGSGTWKAAFFGSTANQLVRSATCPVVTVRG